LVEKGCRKVEEAAGGILSLSLFFINSCVSTKKRRGASVVVWAADHFHSNVGASFGISTLTTYSNTTLFLPSLEKIEFLFCTSGKISAITHIPSADPRTAIVLAPLRAPTERIPKKILFAKEIFLFVSCG